jgi:hypothetical protein
MAEIFEHPCFFATNMLIEHLMRIAKSRARQILKEAA